MSNNLHANAGAIEGKLSCVEINLRNNLEHMFKDELLSNEGTWHSVANDLLQDIEQLKKAYALALENAALCHMSNAA